VNHKSVFNYQRPSLISPTEVRFRVRPVEPLVFMYLQPFCYSAQVSPFLVPFFETETWILMALGSPGTGSKTIVY
jgi:hypothetical protein